MRLWENQAEIMLQRVYRKRYYLKITILLNA